MKAFTIVMKVLAALATVAGAVYLIATYGDKIAAWAKKMLGSCKCCCECDCECEAEETAEETTEEAVEEAAEPAGAEAEVVAAEADFEG